MMALAAKSRCLAAVLCAMLLAALLCLLMPMSARADVRVSLVDEDHQPVTGSLDINSLEGKKFIICCKGSDEPLKGVNINLYNQNDKRLNGSFKTYGIASSLTVGHYDTGVIFDPSALKSGERYTFKLEYLKDDFAGYVESSQLTIKIGDGTDADDSSDDEDQGDGSRDDGKDDAKDQNQDADESGDDEKDNKKDEEKPDNASGDKGKGKTNGSASGDKRGASSAAKKASSVTNNTSKLDGTSKGSQGGDDDVEKQNIAGIEAGEESKSKAAAGHEGDDVSDGKTALASLGNVYSLSDASSPVTAESGGSSDVVALDVTGTPWLFIALTSIMCLALPAGLGTRFFLNKYKLDARSRLGSRAQNANDTERQDN